jgi:hypothetical protein
MRGGALPGVVAAALLGCLALCATGCGGSGRAVPLSTYHPPLAVSPSATRVDPDSSGTAEHTLRLVAKTMKPPLFSDEQSLRFAVVEYQLIITDAGSRDAFAVDQTVARTLKVEPDSSATMREDVLESPEFLTKNDRLRWQASGKPPYASPDDRAGRSIRSELGEGTFTFTSQGAPLTFRQARDLPTSPRALIQSLMRFGMRGDRAPPAAMSLSQYGFLLATAPLTRATRKALLEAVGLLPGVHTCRAFFPGRGSHRDAFCVNGDPTDSELLLDTRTGVADVVAERLDDVSPLYPGMTVGALVSCDTFSLQSSDS